MAKHDLPANQWPELLVFLQQHIKSQQPLQREVSQIILETCIFDLFMFYAVTYKSFV